jgi:dUTPase
MTVRELIAELLQYDLETDEIDCDESDTERTGGFGSTDR